VIAQELTGLEQQVVEVHGVERAQLVLVLGEEAAERRAGLFGLADAEVLGLADHIAGEAGVKRGLLVMDPCGELLHEPHLVGLVEDAEVLLVAEEMGVFPQHPHAEGVEGGEGDELRLLGVHRSRDALAHLLGRLVGEGDREDRVGIHALRDKPRDACRQDARLPRAGTGEDQHRPLPVGGRAVLLGIEIEEAETGHGWQGLGFGSSEQGGEGAGRI